MNKTITNIALSIPLLCINTLGTINHPNYAVRCESPTINKIDNVGREHDILKEFEDQKEEYLKLEKKRQKEEQKRKLEQEKKLEEEKINYYEILVEVSFYCPCSYCCDSETHMTASGKQISYGMIAAPDNFDFGTIIEFDNEQHIVEDRGSYIQTYTDENGNTIHRLDVFLPDHESCLERGRYITTAKVYY